MLPVASRQLIPSLLFSCVHIVQTLPPGSALVSTSKDYSCKTLTPFFTLQPRSTSSLLSTPAHSSTSIFKFFSIVQFLF
ncbi:unnamed protein product [Caenorhabditis nigoni]